MAGAEGERGLDLDADAVGWNSDAVMRAMHGEAPRDDRLQARKARRNPVLRFDLVEREGGDDPSVRGRFHATADFGLVRRIGEESLDVPAPVGALESRNGNLE